MAYLIIFGGFLFVVAVTLLVYLVRLYQDPMKRKWDEYDTATLVLASVISIIGVSIVIWKKNSSRLMMDNGNELLSDSPTTLYASSSLLSGSPSPLLSNSPFRAFTPEIGNASGSVSMMTPVGTSELATRPTRSVPVRAITQTEQVANLLDAQTSQF